MNELTIDAKTDNLHHIFNFLTTELESLGCDKKIIRQCKLCAEEIFMNISSYSYHPETGSVHITMDAIGNPYPVKLVFSFSDTGKPFDPLSNDAPDIDAPLDDRPIGGLGIFLVTTTMDNVSYEYKDGRNVLTMEKNISNNPSGSDNNEREEAAV